MFRLGKKPPKIDSRTLKMAKYLAPRELPPFPEATLNSTPVQHLGMMLNNEIGCCAVAAAAHIIQTWTANVGQEMVVPDSEILKVYSILSGYDPETGQNDDGCYMLDLLNYWRKVGIYGHKIDAFVKMNPRNHLHMKSSIYLFAGGNYTGVALPLSAKAQTGKNKCWQIPPEGLQGDGALNSWGGHAINLPDYIFDGYVCDTWGEQQIMALGFNAYVDETYAVISRDFFVDSKSPAGFNFDELMADVKALAA